MSTESQDTLIILRDRYLALVPTTVQQAHHTREQLNHINALLVDQMIAPGTSAMAIPSATAKLIAPPAKPLAAQPASQRKPKATPAPKPPTKSASEQEKTQRDTVLPLLPSFAGLSKAEAGV